MICMCSIIVYPMNTKFNTKSITVWEIVVQFSCKIRNLQLNMIFSRRDRVSVSNIMKISGKYFISVFDFFYILTPKYY